MRFLSRAKFFCFFIFLGFLFLQNAQAIEPGVAVHGSRGEFLGSAVTLGFTGRNVTGDNSILYLTASHVVQGQPSFRVAGQVGRPVFFDMNYDFAIIAAPQFIMPRIGRSLTPRYRDNSSARFPLAPSTRHLSLQKRNQEKYLLIIDGVDPRTSRPWRQVVHTPVVRTTFRGVPGRDQSGFLLQFEAPFIPGVSGSLISVYHNEHTDEYYQGATDPCGNGQALCGYRLKPLGLITMVAAQMNMVLALPYESISAAVSRMNQQGMVTQVDRELVPGGVRYNQSKITHLRTDNFGSSAHSLRSEMAGVSRGGDGGVTRGGDGGVSRGGDGGASFQVLQRAGWHSGLVFQEQPQNRWLHLVSEAGFFWTEHEGFLETQFLQDRSHKRGIFETLNGTLHRTDAAAPWPIWLHSDLLRENPRLNPGCSNLRMTQFSGASISNARQQAPSDFVFCAESKSQDEQTISLSSGTNRNPNIIFQARFKSVANSETTIESMATYKRQLLTRKGLRTFENENVRIEIDYNSGISIFEKQRNGNTTFFFGPMIY